MLYFVEDLYDYTEETVNQTFGDNDLGNYRIGHYEGKDFIITYVGRGNIKDRLNAHFTDGYHDDYFTFSSEENDLEQFKQECEDYHNPSPTFKLKNKEHPKTPKGRKCPVCGHIGS